VENLLEILEEPDHQWDPPNRGPDRNPDAGGGGDPGNPGGGGNPEQPLNNPKDRLTDKLIRREPEIFDGD
jgi:hypothetical protein